MTPQGTLTTIHSFCHLAQCPEGAGPGSLVLAPNGNFYGNASFGGASEAGTIFELTPAGSVVVLYSFCQQTNCADGAYPTNGLLLGNDGNLYGTTTQGGDLACQDNIGCGTVFRMTPKGKRSVLYAFCTQANCPDGQYPNVGLMQATSGMFYGTTSYGGANGLGTIFRVATGLTPFVETRPASGSPGASVAILGTNLVGTTSVNFNGTVASFTVISKSEIMATVPASATTGKVAVTTPGGVLTSKVAFRIP
jgi:uncharacterized repeat protein (TIGR03803 family)